MDAHARPFQWIDSLPTPAARRALIEALPHALEEERPAILTALLNRPSPASIQALAGQWDTFTSEQRDQLTTLVNRDDELLGKLARSGNPGVQKAAVDMMARIARPSHAPRIAQHLSSRDRSTARRAAQALDAIAITLMGRFRQERLRGEQSPDLATEIDDFEEILIEALGTFPDHRLIGVLSSAATLLPRGGSTLSEFIARDDEPAVMALRGYLKHLTPDALSDRLWPALLLDQTAKGAIDQLDRLARTNALDPVLSNRSHWLALPLVRKRLARFNAHKPPVTQTMSDASSAKPERAHWIGAVPMKHAQRSMLLAALASSPDAPTRLAALRQLMHHYDAAWSASTHDAAIYAPAIARFCQDTDEGIARIAWRFAQSRRFDDVPQLAAHLAQSPHASLRMVANNEAEQWDFESLWPHRVRASMGAAEWLALRQCLRGRRDHFITNVRRLLNDDDRDTVLHTMALVREMRLEPEVELELLDLARKSDARLSATAITALGRISSKTSRTALYLALSHGESRIRSNAIEALTVPEVALHQSLLNRLAADDDNRPRATAICKLDRAQPDVARRHLRAMLSDDRPLHRISALWAASRTGMVECGREVAALASSDPLTEVRTRAAKTAGRLLAKIRINDAQHSTTGHPISATGPAKSDAQANEVADPPAVRLTSQGAPRWSKASAIAGPGLMFMFAESPTRFQAISDGFNERASMRPEWWTNMVTSDFFALWMWMLVVCIAVAGTTRWKMHDERRFGSAWRRFARLANLSWADRRLLDRTARRAGFTNAIALLLSRGAFEHAFATAAGNEPYSPSRVRQIQSLRADLFAH